MPFVTSQRVKDRRFSFLGSILTGTLLNMEPLKYPTPRTHSTHLLFVLLKFTAKHRQPKTVESLAVGLLAVSTSGQVGGLLINASTQLEAGSGRSAGALRLPKRSSKVC